MAQIKFLHKDEQVVKLKATPHIAFDKSKKLTSLEGGEPLYYIQVAEAFKLKLDTFCDFNQKHPVYPDYSLINIPIKREVRSKVF
tara:strand:- start:1139 stop:1393 length:255 start_codon:yes stop_codon:yes gene_type:complete